ncbi:hypothetical protein Ciccas_011506, partial [Cichlidogyrus casuarinus]
MYVRGSLSFLSLQAELAGLSINKEADSEMINSAQQELNKLNLTFNLRRRVKIESHLKSLGTSGSLFQNGESIGHWVSYYVFQLAAEAMPQVRSHVSAAFQQCILNNRALKIAFAAPHNSSWLALIPDCHFSRTLGLPQMLSSADLNVFHALLITERIVDMEPVVPKDCYPKKKINAKYLLHLARGVGSSQQGPSHQEPQDDDFVVIDQTPASPEDVDIVLDETPASPEETFDDMGTTELDTPCSPAPYQYDDPNITVFSPKHRTVIIPPENSHTRVHISPISFGGVKRQRSPSPEWDQDRRYLFYDGYDHDYREEDRRYVNQSPNLNLRRRNFTDAQVQEVPLEPFLEDASEITVYSPKAKKRAASLPPESPSNPSKRPTFDLNVPPELVEENSLPVSDMSLSSLVSLPQSYREVVNVNTEEALRKRIKARMTLAANESESTNENEIVEDPVLSRRKEFL